MSFKIKQSVTEKQQQLDEIKAKEELLRKERLRLEAEEARKHISCDINSESIVSLFSATHDCDTRTVLICKVFQQVKTVEQVKNIDDKLEDKVVWKLRETKNALVLVDNLLASLVVSAPREVDLESFGQFLITKYAEKHYNRENTIDNYSHLETMDNNDVITLMKNVDQQNCNDFRIYQQYRKKMSDPDNDDNSNNNNNTNNDNNNNNFTENVMESRYNSMRNIRFIREITQFVSTSKILKNENQFKISFDNHQILMFFLRLFRGFPQLINKKRHTIRIIDPLKTYELFEGTNEQYFEKQMNHLQNSKFFQNLSFKHMVHQTSGLLSPGISTFTGYSHSLSNCGSQLEIMKQESKIELRDKYLPVFRYNKYFMDLRVMTKSTTIYRVDYNEKTVRVSDVTQKDEKLRASLTAKKKPEKSESSIAYIREEKEMQRMKRGQSQITSFYKVKCNDGANISSSSNNNNNMIIDGGDNKNEYDDNPSQLKKIKLNV